MSDNLNSAAFSACLHTRFDMSSRPDGPPLQLELISVTERHDSPRLEQFSLIFRGPATPLLAQGMCPMVHEKLGNVALFLVPIGPDPEGMLYEAVFNRLRKDQPAVQA